ncbi:peptidase inhibitor family I36 protein [Catenuloplanes atrovinosus]|nr:peptidase inhibitor family I36 protein [Catenuloplanes atrovinosus]
MAVTAVLGAAVASAALVAPAPALASAAAPCPANTFCMYQGAGESGGVYSLPAGALGSCRGFNFGPYQSYRNNSTIEGYFFESAGCTGRAKPVTRNSAANIGFRATTFRFACVSC